jgi:hypothetical protein
MFIIMNISIIKEHINLLRHSFVTPENYPQGLTQNNNMKLRKKKYKPKVQPFIYLKGGLNRLLSPFIYMY